MKPLFNHGEGLGIREYWNIILGFDFFSGLALFLLINMLENCIVIIRSEFLREIVICKSLSDKAFTEIVYKPLAM